MAKAEKQKSIFRIIGLRSENVKRLKVVSISPDGDVINITGENGQGKTSLLDSIWYAIKGKSAAGDMPIRDGQETAKIDLDLGELTIKRTFIRKEDGTYSAPVSVEVEDGFKAAKPQDLLDGIVGELTFDPLAFASMDSKKQFEQLKKFVPDFDFNDNTNRRTAVYNQRTDLNRTIRDLKGQIANFAYDADAPDELVSIADLTDELTKINEGNRFIEQRRVRRDQAAAEALRHRDSAAAIQEDIDSLQERIATLKGRQDGLIEQAKGLESELANAEALPAPEDDKEVLAKISDAEKVNETVRRKNEAKALQARLAEQEEQAKALTKKIDDIDEEKQKAISSADMPVKELSFGDDVVLLNGFPFSDASKAEQITASLQLAMASKPRLRIAFIRDGSLLDKKSMKIIAGIAKELDIQIWLETVERETPGAIVIEDGSVARIVGQD